MSVADGRPAGMGDPSPRWNRGKNCATRAETWPDFAGDGNGLFSSAFAADEGCAVDGPDAVPSATLSAVGDPTPGGVAVDRLCQRAHRDGGASPSPAGARFSSP